MKEQYVNAFLFPAVHVWEQELDCDLTFVGASPRTDQITRSDVSAVVLVSGDLNGWVSYEFRRKDALRLVGVMLQERVFELDEMAESALGEVANMITGNAAIALEREGYACVLAPPLLLSSTRLEFPPTPSLVQIRADFRSPLGILAVRIALGEGELPPADPAPDPASEAA